MFYQETGLRNGSGLEAHAAVVPTRGLEGRSRGGQNGELERSIAITEALDTGSPVASLPLDFSVREPQIPFFLSLFVWVFLALATQRALCDISSSYLPPFNNYKLPN